MGKVKIYLQQLFKRDGKLDVARVLVVVIAVILIVIILMLQGYQQRKERTASKNYHVVVAQLKPSVTRLYYNGTIQPVHAQSISSPVEGVVRNMYFRYGDSITEGQRLFTIESTKAEQDYHTALTDYLKAKDDYVKNKTSFQGTLALYNAKIVDREDFENQKSQLEISELSYITAEKSLKVAAEKIPGEMRIDYTKLSLSDIDAVKKVLQQQSNLITLVAPSSGVALFAERSGDQDSGAKAIAIGAEIKAGQTLLSLGRLVGISTVVYVSETDINKISAGQEVSLTSDALPGIKFKGRVVEVAAQVKASEGAAAGLPTVPVAIIVYDITDQQQKLIKVGMSAKVEILIQNKPQIKIPIDAVFQKEGVAMVTIIDPKTGKMVDVPVETGQTEMEEVSVVKGLKTGDKVVVHDNP